MLRGFPPKAFLIGAQKSGTTQLAELLNQHPEICVSNPKEPDIFSRFYSRGLDYFKDNFSDPRAICIDASTSYTSACLPKYFPNDGDVKSSFNHVVEHIYSHIPDARFIYIMRDPAERTYSAYWHQVRSGQEGRPFSVAIRENTYYMRTSHYCGQIELYLEFFPINQFLFLVFEEFIKNPLDTARKCFRFLNLNDEVNVVIRGGQNKSFIYGGCFGKLNRMLKGIGGLNPLVKLVKPIFPRKILEWGGARMTKRTPKISIAEFDLMAGQFCESIKQLEVLTGLKLDLWPSREFCINRHSTRNF